MDPYLEGSEWTSFHIGLAVKIAHQLVPLLRPRYIARTDKRYVEAIPVEEDPSAVSPEPIPVIAVEIRDVAHRRLITSIELLSPLHKRGESREEYFARRARLLSRGVHLVEIDLLRQGERVPMGGHPPAAHYYVVLTTNGSVRNVWAINLDEPLPTIPIPLRMVERQVPLDLQKAFTDAYDLGGYDLSCDYRRAPDITLDSEQAAWADQYLRARMDSFH